MNAVCVCCLIAAGHVVFQVWPRIQNHFFGVDCWRHMLAADHIRRTKRLPAESMPNYLFRGGFDYPPVVPLIMAFVPTKAALFLQALFSPLVDALHGVLAFTLVVGWTGDLLSAGLAQTMFALVPITALENSQFTGRSAGSLLMTIAIVGPACFFAGEGWTWLVSGMLAGLLVHMTHKMASQTLVFLSLLALPLALRLPGVVIAGPSTVLAALGVFGRAYRRVLAGQIHVLKFFREVLAEEAPRSRRVESPTFVGTLVGLAKRNFLVTAVGADPWVLPIVAAAVLGSRAVLPADIARVILFWVAAIYLLIAGTTYLRPIRFLGDGPRYAYYLAFPLSVLGGPLIAASLHRGGRGALLVAAAASVACLGIVGQTVWIQFMGIVRDKERSYRGDVKAIGEILLRTPGARAAVLPLCTSEVLTYFSGCQVLSADSAQATAENPDFKAYNPVLLKPLGYFLDKYEIDCCVFENAQPFASIELPREYAPVFQGRDYTMWMRQ